MAEPEELREPLKKEGRDKTPERKKEEDEDDVKEIEPTKVEPAKEETKQVQESSSPQKKEPPAPEFGNPLILSVVILMAVLYAVGTQEHISAGKPMALFEPHKVPPPKAGKDEVVIQFCQS